MAKKMKMNMDKFKTSMKKMEDNHKDWKGRLVQAVNDGEHKTAETALKLLHKTREGLHKMIEHVEGHSTKAKAKMEAASEK